MQNENRLFLNQKSFNPWVLSTIDSKRTVDVYLPRPGLGQIFDGSGALKTEVYAGQYTNGTISTKEYPTSMPRLTGAPDEYSQILDMQHGSVTTHAGETHYNWIASLGRRDWAHFWANSDIVISGDPEAQQVTHANMFYLAGSAPGNTSIPPMGLSSTVYNGHIFWDAEIWMMPALVVQHPDLAYGIIDYRFKRLQQAKANASAHGYRGAEYPWESADTGKEEAPAEFAHERHITADIAYAAWQYYLWTGDKQYLSDMAWPILQAGADYWVSRAEKKADGKYHIDGVIGPDETSGQVNDDAWTNGIVAESLRDAVRAANALGRSANPQWSAVASSLSLPFDPKQGIYLEHLGADDHLEAKQADTQMLIYPLGKPMNPKVAGATLDYCLKHTSAFGPAMTDSVNAVIAAGLGRAQQSLDLFHDSYRPFMRGPWDAFSEKRTKDNVYFCTGMGGCLQSVLYGFAGLKITSSDLAGKGKLIARTGDAALYADPHLPPGWTGMIVKGVQFRGHVYDLSVGQGNTVTVVKRI